MRRDANIMALEFNRTFDPHYGEAVAVAPNVRRLTAANGGPFTFTGTNSFIIGAGAFTLRRLRHYADPLMADHGVVDRDQGICHSIRAFCSIQTHRRRR